MYCFSCQRNAWQTVLSEEKLLGVMTTSAHQIMASDQQCVEHAFAPPHTGSIHILGSWAVEQLDLLVPIENDAEAFAAASAPPTAAGKLTKPSVRPRNRSADVSRKPKPPPPPPKPAAAKSKGGAVRKPPAPPAQPSAAAPKEPPTDPPARPPLLQALTRKELQAHGLAERLAALGTTAADLTQKVPSPAVVSALVEPCRSAL